MLLGQFFGRQGWPVIVPKPGLLFLSKQFYRSLF
jgi:hypothetical protein